VAVLRAHHKAQVADTLLVGHPAEPLPHARVHDLRHSFVSVLSDAGVPIEDISRLAGHKSTEVTETVYWHQIRPALLAGAEAMDEVFPASVEGA
jgi:integrase